MGESHYVRWTPRARRKLSSFYTQVYKKWSLKEANKFLDLVQQFERVVSYHPFAYPRSAKNDKYRKSVIHRNTSIIYRIKDERVNVITLIYNRSRPKSKHNS